MRAARPNTSGRFFSMHEPTVLRSLAELTICILLDPLPAILLITLDLRDSWRAQDLSYMGSAKA